MLRAGALSLLPLLLPLRAMAAQTIVETGGGSLTLGGYARALAGVQNLGFELPPGTSGMVVPDHLGLSATVLRLEWKAAVGDHLSAEVHQRMFLRVSSEPLVLGGEKLGLGASAVPRRSVNLRLVAYDEDRLLLEHDFDRLVLSSSLGDFDVNLGRQAITWGVAELFPIADLWTTFSPFELDVSQKRGFDALRVLYSRSRELELEAVVADRGTLRDLSGGLRVATYGAAADLYFALAKHWREAIAFAGVSATSGDFKLRAELAEPWDIDRQSFSPPRATLGSDWLSSTLILTLEAHYNGTGVLRSSEYLEQLGSATVTRGESYFLGRWYVGGAVGWRVPELFQLSLSAVCNLQDPSALFATEIEYQLSQETELSVGAYQGIGAGPVASPETALRSEFGSYGGLYYVALSSFF